MHRVRDGAGHFDPRVAPGIAPHRAGILRVVNAADYSTRPASPGSLVTALGEKVNAVSSGAMGYPVWSSSQIQVPFEAVGPNLTLAFETLH